MFKGLKDKLVAGGLITDNSEQSQPADDDTSQKPVSKASGTSKPTRRPTITVTEASDEGISADASIVSTLEAATANAKNRSYNQFQVIFDNLDGIPEAQRYSKALKLVQASHNLSPDQVIASLDERLSILAQQESEFQSAHASAVDAQVTSQEKEADNIQASIEERKAEIRSLEEKRIQLTREAGNAQVKLQQDLATFNVSYETVRSKLAGERDRLASYIPRTGK